MDVSSICLYWEGSLKLERMEEGEDEAGVLFENWKETARWTTATGWPVFSLCNIIEFDLLFSQKSGLYRLS